ncbi:MAG TPA: helix-turn-helix transcriptional regulator [Polyangiaceae bacterium]
MRRRPITTTGVKPAGKLRPMQSTRALSKAESAHVRRRLEQLLERHGTQTKLARALDMSQQVLSRILGGDAVGLYVARRVASLTGLTLDQVLSTPQAAFDATVIANPKRWSPVTIASVRAMPKIEILGEDALARLLDETETALQPIRKELQRLTR